MNSTTFLYALTKPGEVGIAAIRYFGKADNPKKRLFSHIKSAKDGEKWPVSCWIRKLLKAGQRPDVHTLCEVPQEDFERFERAFITLGRQHGMRLLNATDGGEGCAATPEIRAKISAAHRGRKHSPESCANMSAAHKGKKLLPRSAEHCANMSAVHLNKKTARNTSGFVGVYQYRKKWRAKIASGKVSYIRSFSKIEDAVFVRNLVIANLL